MLIIKVCLLFILMKYIYCKTSITNYPTIDLLENTRSNTSILSFHTSFIQNNSLTIPRSKFILLNLNNFENKYFSIINGSIYTVEIIDREEFVRLKYCLDPLYCQIEVHILVNDGDAYLIIPIHIVDENDNKPSFDRNEIELRYRDNVLNGYQIPFEGAKDIDEGENNIIDYILDCSNDLNRTFILIPENLNQSSKECYSLFHLLILSQNSSTSNYDRLALKFHPSSSSTNIQENYQLKLYAINKNKHENMNKMIINVKIDKEKAKSPKFSLSLYEFVVLINSSLNFTFTSNSNDNKSLLIIGRVYAISHHYYERIEYQLIQNNQTNGIEINSLTGEITWRRNSSLFDHQIEFDVQASSSSIHSTKVLTSRTKVKIFIRDLNRLNNILFYFQINSLKMKTNEIVQLYQSKSFLIDKNMKINEELFHISILSSDYPMDRYILSLNNYFNIFSLISSSSSSSINKYLLKTRQHLQSTSVYLLNISVKHKLSQQWLANLRIELIIVDQWTTTTMKNSKRTTTEEVMITDHTDRTTTTRRRSVLLTSTNVETLKLTNHSTTFCIQNQSYILYQIDRRTKTKKNKKKKKKKSEVGVVKVMEMNMNLSMINESNEIIIDGCRMSLNDSMILNNNSISLNNSFEYELCSSLSINQCFYVKIQDKISSISTKSSNNMIKWFLSMKSIEMLMFILSMIFIFLTFILILLICRLKDVNICIKVKDYLVHRESYGRNHIHHQQQFSPSPSSTSRVHSIVLQQSPPSSSSSFQSIRRKNGEYVFNLGDIIPEEIYPSSEVYIVPSVRESLSLSRSSPSLTYSIGKSDKVKLNNDLSMIRTMTPVRTSSSSSFLQETKQLLEMISLHQHIDVSKLVSEV